MRFCNAILSTGMGPIFKNVAPMREWCFFLRHQKAPAGPTEPGGQGRQGAKKTQNFEDFWGRKPIGNTRLAELSYLMRSDPDKTKVLFLIFDSARGGAGTRAGPGRARHGTTPTNFQDRFFLRHHSHKRDERGRGVRAGRERKKHEILKTFGDGNP